MDLSLPAPCLYDVDEVVAMFKRDNFSDLRGSSFSADEVIAFSDP